MSLHAQQTSLSGVIGFIFAGMARSYTPTVLQADL
jgi:hypothetical protein